MVRRASACLLFLVCCAASARAQEPAPPAEAASDTVVAYSDAPSPLVQPRAPKRPSLLVPLYVSTAVLQGLDFITTRRALAWGAVEGNPLMRPIVGNAAAFAAVKAGTAAGTIWLAERMRKRSRVGAVVLVAAVNSAMTAVVSHNARTISSSF